jgi:hypothetical protein
MRWAYVTARTGKPWIWRSYTRCTRYSYGCGILFDVVARCGRDGIHGIAVDASCGYDSARIEHAITLNKHIFLYSQR